MDDLKVVGAITNAAAATGTGSVTVATVRRLHKNNIPLWNLTDHCCPP